MAFRFLHSGDLHLGKRFGNMAEDLRGRLREARHTVIARLAAHAREQQATVILLAGDTFDAETPTPEIRRQAIAEMRHHAPLRWVLLPGNHDSLQASMLWSALQADLPDNIVLATKAEPLALGSDAVLLPAPCTTRNPGRDLTEWMDLATTPPGIIRLGLAHGAIQSFSEEGLASNVIAPDRATRAGLDYLALGDWHGAVQVDERTFYSGTPEPDRFKHNEPGQAHLVSIEAPGARPVVTQVETGSFSWKTLEHHMLAHHDGIAELTADLPIGPQRRHALLRILATGRSGPAERGALAQYVDQARPDFAYLELDDSGLATECEPDDLDMIDRAGALRDAAQSLLSQAEDVGRSQEERAISRMALNRLFSYCQQVAR
jgi:DNA repair exonuclease SbcCD nuclease subunit